jgi:hypothetical protein
MDEPRYYAECVDLIRKLVLSGLIGLINPGTVFQSFCSVIFSLAFMVTHPPGCSSLYPFLVKAEYNNHH